MPFLPQPSPFIQAWDRHQETQKSATDGWVYFHRKVPPMARFTNTLLNNYGVEKGQCVVCYRILSNESLRPSKLSNHLKKNHPELKNKSIEYFRPGVFKLFDLRIPLYFRLYLRDPLINASEIYA